MVTQPIDLLTRESLQNPHPIFTWLRENEPIHWSERHHSWIVTRYDDVAELFFRPEISSDRVRPLIGKAKSATAESDELLKMIGEWMVVTDPPLHTRLRQLVTPAFRPARIAMLEAQIHAITDDLIDKFIASGETDFIKHVAFQLPAAVISDLLGAPYSDRDLFKTWSDDLALIAFGAGADIRDDRYTKARAALDDMSEYFQGLIELRRREPKEDLISTLVHSESTLDEPLNDAEIKSMCALILFAGHETTTNLMATFVGTILPREDQYRKLVADPSLMKTAVEEVLRYDGSIKILHRWVLDDFALHDVTIKKGDRVFLCLSSANRDPRKFERPEEVDITRHPNPHMAFGKGIHTCIGAQLSRIEARIALEKVFTRLPNMKLVKDELEWVPILSARGLKELHITHEARK
jgi:cytochrome P450